MNFQQLLGSWNQTETVVIINATTAPSLAAFLGQFYVRQGSQITLNNASITEDTEAEVVQIRGTGTADFLNVASAPVIATLSLDSGGNLVLGLVYTMLSPTGPLGWTFATTFPSLPAGLPTTPGGAPTPSLLAKLPLISARFAIASAPYTDPGVGAVPAGISFHGEVQPAGLFGALGSVLPTAAVPLTGTVVIPTNLASIPVPVVPTSENLGASQPFPWDVTPPLPGIQLAAPLGSTLSVGNVSITGTSYLVYSPTADSWPSDPLLKPVAAATGTLALPSAGLSATAFVTVDPIRADTAVNVDVRIQGMSIANLASLADLAGTGSNLLGALPESLSSTVQALSSFELTELYFSILAGPSGLTLGAAGIAIGAPGCSWSAWGDGQIEVSNLSLGFLVLSPMSSSRTIHVAVAGTATIAGAAVKVAVTLGSTGKVMVSTALQEQATLPLSALVSSYLGDVSGIVAPGNLSIDRLSAFIDSSGLQFFGAMAQQQSQPWSLDLGPTSLQVSNVSFNVLVPTAGAKSGNFGGTIGFGDDVSLTMTQSVPGPVKLLATCPSINLSTLLNTLTSPVSWLPAGFDFALQKPSITIDLTDSSNARFQLSTQVDGLGLVALEVARVGGTWGFVMGISLSGQVSSVPGLAALSALEDVLSLNNLTLFAASVTPSGIGLPGVTLPASGLVQGLNAYASINLGGSSALALVRELLHLSPETTLTAALQIGKDPLQDTRLVAGITGRINSSTELTGTLGVRLQNGSLSVAVNGKVALPIQGQSCIFTTTMLVELSPPSAFLAGTMQGSISFSGITLGNLALQIGVNAAGVPSLGVAATVAVGRFSGSVAVFFDSANPSQSLLAGSISDLSLKDVADTLADIADFSVPASAASALSQIQVSGTHEFTLPADTAAALTSNSAAQISAGFRSVGITLPTDPAQLLVVAASASGTWHLTDLSTMRHYSLVQGDSGIRGSLDTQLYVAPQATMIGTLGYPQGFFLNGKLSFFGFSLSATVQVSSSKGLSVDATMSPLVFHSSNLFSLTGAGGQGGPRLSISTYHQPDQVEENLRPPHVLISAELTLLGCTQSVYISVGQSGLAFAVTFTVPPVSWAAAGSFNGLQNMAVSGDITVGLQGVPPLDFGPLGRVNLNTSLSGGLSLSYSGGTASASISGAAVVAGQSFSIGSHTLDVDSASLAALPQIVADALNPLIKGFLGDVEKWAGWVRDGFMQGVEGAEQIGQVLANTFNQTGAQIARLGKDVLGYGADGIAGALHGAAIAQDVAVGLLEDLGYGATDIAGALKSVWACTDSAAVDLLKRAGYTADEVGEALKNVWAATDAKAASLLRGVGYAALDVANALQDVWSCTDVAVVAAMKQAGYWVQTVGDALSTIWNHSASVGASVLKSGGYFANDVGSALKGVWGCTESVAAGVLKEIGFYPGDVAKALKTVWETSSAVTANILKSVGFNATEAGNALKIVWSETEAGAASLLKGAGYTAAEVGSALKNLWGVSSAAGASLLKDAGYLVAEIGDALKNTWGSASSAATGVLNQLGYTATEVGSVLKSVWTCTDSAAVNLLKGAGYAAGEVSGALKSIWAATETTAASLLRGVGYAPLDVATALKDVWACTDVAVVSAMKQAGFWVKVVGDALIQVWGHAASAGASVLKAGGYFANDVASALKSAWGCADDVAAGILKKVGFTAVDVAQALKTFWNGASGSVAQILKDVGFPAGQTGNALKSVWAETEAGGAELLKTVGYGAVEVGNALKNIWSVADAAGASLLKTVGYGPDEVGEALKSAWKVMASRAAEVMKSLNYTATQVGGVLKSFWASTDSAAASALKTATYALNDIGTALKSVWTTTDGGVAKILKGLSYSASDVGGVLKEVWASTDAAAASALLGAFYAVKEIGSVLKSLWSTTDASAAKILKDLSCTASDVGGALKSVWASTEGAAAKAMKDAGFVAGEVAGVLKSLWSCTEGAAAKAMKDAGFVAGEVAGVLKSLWGCTEGAAAKAMKDAGFLVGDVARELKSLWGCTEGAAAKALKDAGFLAGEVANMLKSLWSCTEGAAAKAMKDAGFLAGDVARELKSLWGCTEGAAAKALKGAGFVAGDVAKVLKSLWSCTEGAAAKAMRDAGFLVGEVAKELKSLWGCTDGAAAKALRGAGFVAGDVAKVLKSLWSCTDGAAAKAMRDAGFAAGEVAKELKSLWGCTDAAAAKALRDAGYTAGEVGGALKTVWGLSDSAATRVLKDAGYGASEVANALKSVWGVSGDRAAQLLYDVGFSGSAINSAIDSVYGSLHVDTTFGHIDVPSVHTDIPGWHSDTHVDGSEFGIHGDVGVDKRWGHTDAVTTPHGDTGTHIDT